MRCAACGSSPVAGEQLPFRCPEVGGEDDADHLLGRDGPPSAQALPSAGDPNPFIRYRQLLYSWEFARWRGMSDESYVALVRALDSEIAQVDDCGFTVTPYGPHEDLADAIDLSGGLWIKNETVNVSGSHKARHLMGIGLYLAVADATGLSDGGDSSLAIASCGNAALAAAVVARAAQRSLQVFVPPSVEPGVARRLEQLGADLVLCERRASDPVGDPCYLRFLEAVAAGALPFACQGNQNGLTIDGGMTLGFELVAQHAAGGWPALDRLLLQIGGGALASATMQALRWAHARGLLERVPAIHAVQTESAHPVVDAWRRVAAEIEGRLVARDIPKPAPSSDAARARWIFDHRDSPAVEETLRHAAQHRSQYMKPIDHAPHSIASGILDDETYDWHQVVRGMIETGGWPVVVSEDNLARARDLGRADAKIDVCATGASGLAGLLTLLDTDEIPRTDRVAVLFTGVQR